MDFEPKPDWEEKLQEVEVKINNSPLTNQARNWFSNLPKPAQIAVVAGTIFLTFTILNIFLKILTSILTIAVLIGILYVIYRFVLAANSHGD
ncbi:hypothetical protein [Gloeocapsa sp. PCC 73106]|uniref:hypothetical protein n=1 Tax=Gloeocapsa sp. PCC 73106 TaxID=102232 RepID=UPI0002ABDD3A|nr:hypothetical protein [Gloeocapsa sp. PCC 73106]ELR97856.1 hypothetical protein GLO73106DRAFT_00016730 [Gloeocapsa sp. PCC 73106]